MHWSRLALTLVGAAALAAPATADVILHITGDVWTDPTWATTDYATGSGGAGSGAQTTTGNPAPGRLVTNSLNSGASTLNVFHRKTNPQALIHPSEFEISSIDLTIDAIFVSGVGQVGQRVGVALRQNGIDYQTPAVTTGVDKINWVTRTATYTPADFVRMDGAAGAPDFSRSGGDLRFGFYTANSNSAGSGPITQKVIYDNLDIALHGSRLLADTEWADADWTSIDFTTGSGGSDASSQSTAEGNPAPARLVVHQMSAGQGVLDVFHKNLTSAAVIDLAGASVRIASIDFSIDARYLSGVGGNGQSVGLAIEQDGVAYRTNGLTTGSSGSWVSRDGSFTASDFVRYDGLPGTPDFSPTATPITLGFRTRNSNGAGSGPFNQRVAYDNLLVRVNCVCAADLNADGQVDFADYLEFLNLFDTQDPSVDYNHDGFVDFADYLEFLNLFDAAC